MRAAWLVLVAACSKAAPAEDKAPRVPAVAPAPAPMPLWDGGPPLALRWITARPAWHTPAPIDWMLAVGDDAIVASERWIARMSPTGTIANERTFDAIYGGVLLDAGRIALLASKGDATTLIVLDAKTLATLVEKALPSGDATTPPSIARVPDGALVLALPDQPLALYDPKTFDRTRVLAKRTDWTNLEANATSVYASRPNPNYSAWDNKYPTERGQHSFETIDVRIDLKTGTLDEEGRLPLSVGPDLTYQPVARLGFSGEVAVFRESSDRPIKLEDDIGVGPEGQASAFSDGGDAIAVEDAGEVALYSVFTGKLKERYPIADPNWFDSRAFPIRALVFASTWLYVAYEQEIRVIDLAKQTVSPAPAPPSASLSSLLVSDSGDVQTIDRVVARFSNGRVTTHPLRGDALLLATSTLGVYGSFVFSGNAPSTLFTFRDGTQVSESSLTEISSRAWITSRGSVVFSTLGRDEQKPIETIGGVRYVRAGDQLEISDDATVAIRDGRPLDMTTGIADTQGFAGPCKYENQFRLDPSGARVVAWNGDSVMLWDRATKKQLGWLQIPASVWRREQPLEVSFLRGTTDLAIRVDRRSLVVWSPTTKEIRVVGANLTIATSPDGQLLGVVTGDGRVALVPYRAFRAAIEPAPAPAGSSGCPNDLLLGP